MHRSRFAFALLCSLALPAFAVEHSSPARTRTKGEPLCRLPIATGVMDPQVACSFRAAPPGDGYPEHLDLAAPLVVFPGGAHARSQAPTPLLAGVFADLAPGSPTLFNGVLRVLDPFDCSQQQVIAPEPQRLAASYAPAVADAGADIGYTLVAAGSAGATHAYARVDGTWQSRWSTAHEGAGWNAWEACESGATGCSGHGGGFVLHDLDDQLPAEVVRYGTALAFESGAYELAPPAAYTAPGGRHQFMAPGDVVMNIDDDPAPEISDGAALWEYVNGQWVVDPAFAPAVAQAGQVAFGTFVYLGPDADPYQIVRVRSGVYELLDTHGTQLDARALPGAPGVPVAPTIADTDGDRQLETIVVSSGHVSVLDLDCGPTQRFNGTCSAGTCDFAGGPCPPGFAWSRALAESGVLPSPAIAFDFEDDLKAEVIHSDRCYTRAYDARGRVLFSRAASGFSFGMMPTVYGDRPSEIARLVVPANADVSAPGCAADASGADPLFAGAACQVDADCTTGACDGGLCRCVATAQCCDAGTEGECAAQGFLCATPPAGTAGSGNTCRTVRTGSFQGFTVFADPRWARTLPIWHQAAFDAGGVDEDGRLPRASLRLTALDFRTTPAFTRFAPDVELDAARFTCQAGVARVEARFCNNGAQALPAGASLVAFEGGIERCRTVTDEVLVPGECDPFACAWSEPPRSAGEAATLTLRGDRDNEFIECEEDDNETVLAGVFCPPSAQVFAHGFESP